MYNKQLDNAICIVSISDFLEYLNFMRFTHYHLKDKWKDFFKIELQNDYKITNFISEYDILYESEEVKVKSQQYPCNIMFCKLDDDNYDIKFKYI